jgi:hypothetical protein
MPPVRCQRSRCDYPEDEDGRFPLNLITDTPIQMLPYPKGLEFLTS